MYAPLIAEQLLSTSAQKKFDKLETSLEANPFVLAELCPHIIEGVGHAAFYVTMGELLDSHLNETYTQYTVKPERVLDLMTSGDYALAKVRTLYKPIHIGFESIYLDNGVPVADAPFVITGGRHRFTALITVYTLSGIDICSDEFRAMKIRVEPELYSLAAIECDNGSRSMSSGERVALEAQRKDVDVNDTSEIIAAIGDKRLTKTKAFSLLFQARHTEEPVTDLQLNTLGTLGGKFINALIKLDPTQSARLKEVNHAEKILDLAFEKMPIVLAQLTKKGVTNIALNGVNSMAESLATYAASKTKVKVKTKRVSVPDEAPATVEA